jgi:NO-binding membrane sensor protein with MHYT domain
MHVTYDPVLILVSIGIAILGAQTAFALTAGGYDRRFGKWRTSFALANSGLIMGLTSWATHLVGLMAVTLPVPLAWAVAETVGSCCVAIAGTGAGLYIARARLLRRWSIPAGAFCMGLGIVGMHYLGMSAVRGPGLAYDLRLVLASVVLGIAASWVGLWLAMRRRGVVPPLAGGTVQGLAVAGTHYVAMAGTFFVPLELGVEEGAPFLGHGLIAYLIAGGIAALSIANLVLLGLTAIHRARSAPGSTPA